MDGLHPLSDQDGVADVFIDGQAMRITAARTYFRLKNMVEWCALCGSKGRHAPIRLHPWDSWDALGDRLSARWDVYLWHPSHWDRHYATLPDIPVSIMAAASWRQPLETSNQETTEEQYALFM